METKYTSRPQPVFSPIHGHIIDTSHTVRRCSCPHTLVQLRAVVANHIELKAKQQQQQQQQQQRHKRSLKKKGISTNIKKQHQKQLPSHATPRNLNDSSTQNTSTHDTNAQMMDVAGMSSHIQHVVLDKLSRATVKQSAISHFLERSLHSGKIKNSRKMRQNNNKINPHIHQLRWDVTHDVDNDGDNHDDDDTAATNQNDHTATDTANPIATIEQLDMIVNQLESIGVDLDIALEIVHTHEPRNLDEALSFVFDGTHESISGDDATSSSSSSSSSSCAHTLAVATHTATVESCA